MVIIQQLALFYLFFFLQLCDASLCPVSSEPACRSKPERVSFCGRSSGLQPTGESRCTHRGLQGNDPKGTFL